MQIKSRIAIGEGQQKYYNYHLFKYYFYTFNQILLCTHNIKKKYIRNFAHEQSKASV